MSSVPWSSYGIYTITFPDDPTESVYIGSTRSSFRRRFRDHLSYLERGAHRNHYISRLYAELGDPVFTILEVCLAKEDVLHREKHYIDTYPQPEKLINLEADPVSHKMKKEVRKKIGKILSKKKYKRGKRSTSLRKE